MKRIVLIIIIIAYCFISFSMLFENGTDLSIDYKQLRTQNEYEGSIDKIPENISEKMLLTIKNKYASLKMDIEGEYQRQPITDQALELVSQVVKSTPDFMWSRIQSEQTTGSKIDVIIIFTSDNSCVICFPLENKIK